MFNNVCFVFEIIIIIISQRREQRKTVHMSLKRHHRVHPNTIGPQRGESAPIACRLTQKTFRWARVIGPIVWRLLNLMRPRAVGGEHFQP